MYTMGSITLLFVIISLVGLGQGSPDIKVISVEPDQFTPDAQIQKDELILITNITRIVIHCSAHYPVQWNFSGYTSPLQLEVKAIRKSGPKLSDPTFIAQLLVYRVTSAITGTYRCQSVLNPLKESVVHIYAQDKGYRGQDPILLKYGTTVDVVAEDNNESRVKFPCAVWDPTRPVHLYKKSEMTGKFERLKTDGISLVFDPKEGFEMNLKDFDRPWGKYLCSPDIERTFDRVYVNLLPKPDFRVNPSQDVVEVAEGQPLLLKCESEEEVKWNILGSQNDDPRVEINSDHSPGSLYPYVSVLSYSNLNGADGSEIECVTKKDARRLHKWSYQVVGKHDLTRRGIVKFHSRRTNMDCFACWARTSKSPDMSFIECKNPMECQIRGQCLQNANKCDPAYVRLCSGGCALASIENRTGILQCSGEGIFQQIRQFLGTSGDYLYNSIQDAAQKDKLALEGKHVAKAGSSVEFKCTGSSFLFAEGFRWGLKSQESNSVRILEPTSKEVLNFQESFLPTGNIQAKVLLQMDSVKITHVKCFAPYWNTTDWEDRNLRIFVESD